VIGRTTGVLTAQASRRAVFVALDAREPTGPSAASLDEASAGEGAPAGVTGSIRAGA